MNATKIKRIDRIAAFNNWIGFFSGLLLFTFAASTAGWVFGLLLMIFNVMIFATRD